MTHRRSSPAVLLTCVFLTFVSAVSCSRYRDDLDYSHEVVQTWDVEHLQYGQIVQFDSVFWEPDDTVSLRKLIVDDAICAGRDVLEIGTGTGLVAVFCAQNSAARVVATDINPAAVANARYNAAMLAEGLDVEVRIVEKENPAAFSVIKASEKFDLIISNPPWEDGTVNKPAEHAFYDPEFKLMDSLLDGLPKHLSLGGRCLLAYGHKPAIIRLQAEAESRNYKFKILDDRKLDDLDDDFLPGMLVEIRMPLNPNSPVGKKQLKAAVSKDTSEKSDADTDVTVEPQAIETTKTKAPDSTLQSTDGEQADSGK